MPDQVPIPVHNRDKDSLPAPYTSPWGSLGDDLRAVLADLRLRGQELWRRNREGDLSVPGFWPRDLAPLFWPVVVALVLLFLGTVGVLIRRSLPSREPLPPEVVAPPSVRTIPDSPEIPIPPIEGVPALAPIPAPLPANEVPQPEPDVVPTAPPDASVPDLDPLLSLLLDQSPVDSAWPAAVEVLQAARPIPEQNAVELLLDESWSRLPLSQRQHLADGWWQQLSVQGYSDLILRSVTGAELGRTARIGSGMVVNSPLP